MIIAQKGSKGSIVFQLQEKLKELGLYVGKIDGDFGKLTHDALISYQTKMGVNGDGLLGQWISGKLGIQIHSTKYKTLCLTSGHDNKKQGAAAFGYTEHLLMTPLRDALADRLRKIGVVVFTDGESGDNEILSNAVKKAALAEFSLELHLNASSSSSSNGAEVLSWKKHKAAAQRIAYASFEAYGFKLRGGKGWKAENSGQYNNPAFCNAGGLIGEFFFITNQSELSAYLKNPKALEDALFNALVEILKL